MSTYSDIYLFVDMAEAADSQTSRLEPVGAFVADRKGVTFFALTLTLSWAVWVPGVVGLVDFGSLVLGAIVVGGFGPLVAAAIVTWLVGDSLHAWTGQVLRWRVRPRWYLVGLGVPLVLIVATSGVYVALGNPNPIEQSVAVQQVPTYVLPLIYALNMVFVFLLGGGQEELGWRGFALPRLLGRVDAVTASLVIGAVWAVWHLPLFVMEGSSQSGRPFVPYAITLLALSILFTWLYRATGRSVLLAMLLHASYNSAPVLLPIQSLPATLDWVYAAVMWAFALSLVVVYGRDLRSGEPDDRETMEGRTPPAA